MSQRLAAATGLLAVLFSGGACAGQELWQRDWVQVSSPHFVIVSAMNESRTVELTKELEDFRVAVRRAADLQPFEERIPTRVYVFPQALDEFGFRHFGSTWPVFPCLRGEHCYKPIEANRVVGYFAPRMRGNYAAIVDSSGHSSDDVLKHEYVHYLLRNSETHTFPLWFDEGYAQMFQTLSVNGTTIEYGRLPRRPRDMLAGLPWMSFEKLLEVRDSSELKGSQPAMFYAQSQLLLHYLMLRGDRAAFQAQLRRFLAAGESGMTSSEAFEQGFGIEVDRLRATLIRYAAGRTRYRKLRLPAPLPAVDVTTRPVTSDSIAAQLGWLLLGLGEKSEARRYWDAALKLNPDNARALVGEADQLAANAEFADAEVNYRRAIELEPHDGYHELDYGAYFLYRARLTDDPEIRDGLLVEARRHFARSYAIDPNDPETLALNGSSYLFPGQPLLKAVQSLRAAHEMLPSQPRIRLLLAQAYAVGGDDGRAAALLRSVVAWDDPESAVPARELLDRIEARLNQPLNAREDPRIAGPIAKSPVE
jgi:tetratricopeptide (TPR) repeat protein